jgi:hypothetical protein
MNIALSFYGLDQFMTLCLFVCLCFFIALLQFSQYTCIIVDFRFVRPELHRRDLISRNAHLVHQIWYRIPFIIYSSHSYMYSFRSITSLGLCCMWTGMMPDASKCFSKHRHVQFYPLITTIFQNLHWSKVAGFCGPTVWTWLLYLVGRNYPWREWYPVRKKSSSYYNCGGFQYALWTSGWETYICHCQIVQQSW